MLLDVTHLLFGPVHVPVKLPALIMDLFPESHTLFPSLKRESILILLLAQKGLIYMTSHLGLARVKSVRLGKEMSFSAVHVLLRRAKASGPISLSDWQSLAQGPHPRVPTRRSPPQGFSRHGAH